MKFMVTNKELLKIYMQGFNDELNSKTSANQYDDLKQRAYNLGRIDAIAGDDVSSVDLQSKEEILDKIRK
jgi:hypothetical protein